MLLNSLNGNEIHLKGNLVDNHTRCIHYHTDLDIIAIKFKCCECYYPCYQCHNELETHDIEKFSIDGDEKVILCGDCNLEMSFNDYKSLKCPNCTAPFNPGCKYHYNIYFNSHNTNNPNE